MSVTVTLAVLLTGAAMPPESQQVRSVPRPIPMPVPMVPPPLVVVPPPPPSPITSRRAVANLAVYFSEDDYPAAALRLEEEGTTGFSIAIDPTGRVSDCRITASSGSVSLDQATCRIIRSRAQYRPARNALGQPAPGSDYGRVSWRLPLDYEDGRAGIPRPAQSAFRQYNFRTLLSPGDYPDTAFRARAAGVSASRLAIGRDGRIIGCAVEQASGSAALDVAACRILIARARYGPAMGEDGAPVCDIDVVHLTWRLPPSRPAWARSGAVDPAPPRLSTQLNATLCPGWTTPPPEEDTPPPEDEGGTPVEVDG